MNGPTVGYGDDDITPELTLIDEQLLQSTWITIERKGQWMEGLKQRPQSFVLDFTELCQDTEIPSDLALWTALAGVSCALGRQVFLRVGTLTFYPNIYVCLVAKSGSRKSAAIEVLEPIIYGMEPRPNLIAQKITPEALISAMRLQEKSENNILFKEKSQGFIFLDELTSLVTRMTYEGLSPLLLQFYNCKSYFTYETKGSGKVVLNDTCLGFIAATTPDALASAIPDTAIGDGLTARIAFVYVNEESGVVPVPTDTPRKRELRDNLQRTISRVAALQGEMKMTKPALDMYIKDYTHFRQVNTQLTTHTLLRGYAQRRHSHMFKLAMLLAASESSMEIDEEHVSAALSTLEIMEQNLLKLMLLISASDYGRASSMVLDLIAAGGGDNVRKRDVIRGCGHRIDARTLETVVQTLVMGGYVKEEFNGEATYRLLKLKE